jgi:hypothetical protein
VYAVADASPAQSRVALVAHRGFYLLSQKVKRSAAADVASVAASDTASDTADTVGAVGRTGDAEATQANEVTP